MSMPRQSWQLRRGKGLCLLSFDAGGSRSISQLKILAEVMHRIKFEADSDIFDRPCSVFDMIGGVGSGGFIAILLVVFKLTAEEALSEFVDLSVNVLDKLGLDSQARTNALRGHIVDLMSKYGTSQEVCLLDPSDNSRGSKLVIFISYKHHIGGNCTLRNFTVRQQQTVDLTIMEALLATVATPPLFESLSISKDSGTIGYIGADWMLSNPMQEIIAEAYGAFGAEAMVACLLSLGCGHPGILSLPDGPKLLEWSQTLEMLTTHAERKAQSLEFQIGPLGLYHRFSVTNGLEREFQENVMDPGVIIACTEAYISDAQVSRKLDTCVDSLSTRDAISSLEQLTHPGGNTTSRPHLPPLTKSFVMRKEPWDLINRIIFQPREGNDTATLRILIVTGIGGCGKTQLMVKFIIVHEAEFLSWFFIDGSSEDRIKADIIRNVRALGTEHSQKGFDECLLFLSNPQGHKPRLLLYDNVDDPELDLSSLIPRGGSCAIVITSRNHILGNLYPGSHVQLDIMSIDEAVDLLSYGFISFTEQDRKDVEDLARYLGCLPIALQQACSYMKHTRCSIKAYLERLSTNRAKLLGREIKQQIDMKAISTYAAFETSFLRLSLYVQKLLWLLSHFHWSGFPLNLIILAAKHQFSEYGWRPVDHGNEFYSGKQMLEEIFYRNGKWDITNLDEMLLSLQNYSLVTVIPGVDTLISQIHPLVHEWLRSCTPRSAQVTYQSAAVILLALGTHGSETATMQYLSSHVIHMAPLWDHLHVNNLVAFAYMLFESGIFQEALKLQEMVVKELRRSGDMNEISLVYSLLELARAYWGCGRLNEAQEIQEGALTTCKRVLGERHPESLNASVNLAATYFSLGRLNDAEKLVVKALETSEEVLGRRHPDTLNASTTLAVIYHGLGRLEEAAFIQTKALEITREVLGNRHPDTLNKSVNLAITYHDLGFLNEAAVMQVEALKISKEILGERHPDTLYASNSLALIYRDLGRLKDAELLQYEAMKISKAALGEHHPITLVISACQAILYRDLGLLDKAEVLQSEVLKTYKATLGDRHPTTINASHHLSITYREESRFEDALALQEEVLAARKDVFGEHHIGTILASSDLASVFYYMGRLQEGEMLATEVLKHQVQILGPRHPDTLVASNNLAAIYRDQERLEEAEVLQLEVVGLMREVLGNRHFKTTKSMLVLAKIYQSQRRKEEALELLTAAEDIISKELGISHPQYIEYLDIRFNVESIRDSLHEVTGAQDDANSQADLASTSQSKAKEKWYRRWTPRKVFGNSRNKSNC